MTEHHRWQLRLGSWAADIYSLTPEAESLAATLRERLETVGFATNGAKPSGTYLAVASPAVPPEIPLPEWMPSDAQPLWGRFLWMLRHAHAADSRKEESARSPRSRRGVFTFSWPPADESASSEAPLSPQFHALVLKEERASSDIMLLALMLYLATTWHVSRGGLVVHSSAVARGDDGFLFLGDSEAGKSTSARLSASIGRPSLGDDMNLVIREGSEFTLAALPSPKVPDQGYGQSRPPLRAIFKLAKGSTESLTPLSTQETTRALHEAFRQVPAGRALPAPSRSLAFTTVCDLARDVPGFTLHFRETPDFWRLIDARFPS